MRIAKEILSCSPLYPRATGGYAFEFPTDASLPLAAERILARARVAHCTVQRTSALKDSQDVNDHDRLVIIRQSSVGTQRCREELCELIEESSSDMVIVLHGTDTMLDTGRYLHQQSICAHKLILLCGAFLPECFKDTDADFNLGPLFERSFFLSALLRAGIAIGAGRALRINGTHGVYVCMNGRIGAITTVSRDIHSGNFIFA